MYNESDACRIGVAGDHEHARARNWAAGELGTVAMRDQRPADQLIETLAMFAEHLGKTIPSPAGAGRGQRRRIGRWLTMMFRRIRSWPLVERTIERRLDHDVVLCIRDISHVVYGSLPNDGGIALCGSPKYRNGVLMHSALAVTTEGIPLGLLDQAIWTCSPGKTSKNRAQRKCSIEDNESAK